MTVKPHCEVTAICFLAGGQARRMGGGDKALIDIGHIKAGNFSKNPNKSIYLYLLTPQGIAEKTKLTADFLKRKMVEYHALKKEIDSLKSSLKD